LDNRVAETYAKLTDATNKNSLYDSYIKSFRWASDRLDESGGIIAFISNGSWIDGNATEGFRRSLEQEFTSIYVFNLRGNQRTSGELSRKEGGKIFGSGSRTPISITLLVKNPNVEKETATIYYHDIGDYLSREQKLDIIKNYGSIGNAEMPWTILKPNEHGDWISLRNVAFGNYIQLEPEKKYNQYTQTFFNVNSRGLETSRDSWVYNSSKRELEDNINKTIDYYNKTLDTFQQKRKENLNLQLEDFIVFDPSKFSWTRGTKDKFKKSKCFSLDRKSLKIGLYRPYFKQNVYVNSELNEYVNHFPKFFPTDQHDNTIICLPGVGNKVDFSLLIVNKIPDLGFLAANQSFPLYYYEENTSNQEDMFGEDSGPQYTRKDAISDFIYEKALQQYGLSNTGSGTISKEDIFYYVYGFLHSPEYRETFANDLKKMLPRIPLVDSINDFWAFSKAGRALADLHINYESIAPYPDCIVTGAESSFFTVEKMRFPKKGQKDTINYNSKITISKIPEKAYEYVVNGKSAIEWIMERYQITTHKDSGITNNPNDWSEEVGNPRYILDLLLSIINVSVQTVDIVSGLPKVKFGE
jgi:predicted helicase